MAGRAAKKGVLPKRRAAGFDVNGISWQGAARIDSPTLLAALEPMGHLIDRPTYYALGALVDYLQQEAPDIEGRIFFVLFTHSIPTDHKSGLPRATKRNLRFVSDQQSKRTLRDRLADTLAGIPWLGPEAPITLEATWSKKAHFLDASFLEKGAAVARAVCRVEDKIGTPLGTGFTVGPDLVSPVTTSCHQIRMQRRHESDSIIVLTRWEPTYRGDLRGQASCLQVGHRGPGLCVATS